MTALEPLCELEIKVRRNLSLSGTESEVSSLERLSSEVVHFRADLRRVESRMPSLNSKGFKAWKAEFDRSRLLLENGVEELRFATAVRWAVEAWRSIFYGLLARAHKEGLIGFRIEADPAFLVVRSLSLRSLKDPAGAVSYVKENIAYLTAVMLGQKELPTFTDPEMNREENRNRRGVLGGGWVYRLCRRLMAQPITGNGDQAGRTSRILGLATDILMSKFGRGRVPDEMITAALEKHWRTLTVEHTCPDEQRRQEIAERIDEVVERMFRGRTFDPVLCLPSMNAAFGCSRKDGGGFSQMIEEFNSELELPNCVLPYLDVTAEHGFLPERRVPGSEPRSLLLDFGSEVHVSVADGGIRVAKSVPLVGVDLVEPFLRFVEQGALSAVASLAQPVAIPEPDKVRIITKASRELQYVTLCLQKFMHGVVKGFPAFEYIGQPIDEASFAEHFSELGDEEFLVSGDYKAATDNLDPSLSLRVWDAICRTVRTKAGMCLQHTSWYEFGRKSLTEHILVRSSVSRTELEQIPGLIDDAVQHGHVLPADVCRYVSFRFRRTEDDTVPCVQPDKVAPQRWGQLMGSPMSFPILCIVNFCASTLGLGIPYKSCLLRRGPCVVNGDDLGAKCRFDRYELWKEYVTAAGLQPSLGKNYTSRSFLVMNSEMRRASVSEGRITWSRVGFLNQSLLFGLEKKGQDAGTDMKKTMLWSELGERCREMIADVPLKDQRAWRSWFEDIHREVLHSMPPGCSRYTSVPLGGAGIPYIVGDDEVSVEQRRVAALFAVDEEIQGLFAKLRAFSLSPDTHPLCRLNARAETHYSGYLPAIRSDRPEMDVVLENWGFPVTREKSSLGNAYRLGYILHMSRASFLAGQQPKEPIMGYTRAESSAAERLDPRVDFTEVRHGRTVNRTPEALKEDLGKQREALVRKLSYRILRRQKLVSRADGELLPPDDRLPGLRRPGLEHHPRPFPVAPSTAVEWTPPTEDLIQWENLPSWHFHLKPDPWDFDDPVVPLDDEDDLLNHPRPKARSQKENSTSDQVLLTDLSPVLQGLVEEVEQSLEPLFVGL